MQALGWYAPNHLFTLVRMAHHPAHAFTAPSLWIAAEPGYAHTDVNLLVNADNGSSAWGRSSVGRMRAQNTTIWLHSARIAAMG